MFATETGRCSVYKRAQPQRIALLRAIITHYYRPQPPLSRCDYRSIRRFIAATTSTDFGLRFFYRRSRPSASGLDREGEGRRKINEITVRTVDTVRNPQRRVKDLNPTLTETIWKCDSSQNPRLWRGATGVVGRGGAADPHGRIARSGVNSSRPISGRSRGIKFACVHPSVSGRSGQNGEASGLVPEVLHY